MLRLNGAGKKYGSFELDATLQVQEGCVTGLVGQNGAGKSTIFKLLLNLINADSGSVTILGKKVSELSNEDKAQIGVVLAESGFNKFFTVKEVIGIMDSLYKKFDKNEFIKKCEQFGLPLNKKIGDFSTGMKAKLKVLTAMSHDAKILLMDEPTAGLDVVAREELLDLMRAYLESGNRSILISSHISSDLEGMCDDLYMIHDGKIVLHEETDVLLSEYGMLKVTPEQYEKMDKNYMVAIKKENHGYNCITNQRQFYAENYPGIAIEKGTIDDVLTVMIRGERV